MNFYLGCHDQLVIDNIVLCIPVCFDMVSKQTGIHSINRSLASPKSKKVQVMNFYLGCHDQLMVDNIVLCIPVCFDMVSKQTGIHSINRSLASPKSNKVQVMNFYLGRHDQLVVDNVVWCVSHTEECTGRVKMTRHSSSHVHVFSNALQV